MAERTREDVLREHDARRVEWKRLVEEVRVEREGLEAAFMALSPDERNRIVEDVMAAMPGFLRPLVEARQPLAGTLGRRVRQYMARREASSADYADEGRMEGVG